MPELTADELALIEAGAAVEDESDEVDEVLAELQSQKTLSETRYTELSERLNQCLSRLEALSAGANAENPMLLQLSNQVAEMKGEITTALKSFTDSNRPNPEPNDSTLIAEEVDPVLPEAEKSMVEPSEENEPPKPPRKNRMV